MANVILKDNEYLKNYFYNLVARRIANLEDALADPSYNYRSCVVMGFIFGLAYCEVLALRELERKNDLRKKDSNTKTD